MMKKHKKKQDWQKRFMRRMCGNAGSGRPWRTFFDQIDEVLEKGQVKSTRNQRACMSNLITVEEAKGVCKDLSKRKEGISAYPNRRDVCMYVWKNKKNRRNELSANRCSAKRGPPDAVWALTWIVCLSIIKSRVVLEHIENASTCHTDLHTFIHTTHALSPKG
jgi:hypothetical protein